MYCLVKLSRMMVTPVITLYRGVLKSGEIPQWLYFEVIRMRYIEEYQVYECGCLFMLDDAELHSTGRAKCTLHCNEKPCRTPQACRNNKFRILILYIKMLNRTSEASSRLLQAKFRSLGHHAIDKSFYVVYNRLRRHSREYHVTLGRGSCKNTSEVSIYYFMGYQSDFPRHLTQMRLCSSVLLFSATPKTFLAVFGLG